MSYYSIKVSDSVALEEKLSFKQNWGNIHRGQFQRLNPILKRRAREKKSVGTGRWGYTLEKIKLILGPFLLLVYIHLQPSQGFEAASDVNVIDETNKQIVHFTKFIEMKAIDIV